MVRYRGLCPLSTTPGVRTGIKFTKWPRVLSHITPKQQTSFHFAVSIMSQLHTAVAERLQTLLPQRVPEDHEGFSAVAVLLLPTDSGGEIFLIRRAERPTDHWSGHMALPGGRRQASDVDLLETAIRETREETGVELKRELVLGELDDLRSTTPSLPPVVVRPYVFGLHTRPEIIPNHEVAGHIWVNTRELVQSEKVTTVSVRGKQMQVEGFVVASHVIWGMTRRIIKPFLELVNSTGL